ncbi:MAG: hypothetical protein KGM43_12850 [Planctomycetota bacterium]|nr:hypothetical protein [Planctomycetota bacterium]
MRLSCAMWLIASAIAAGCLGCGESGGGALPASDIAKAALEQSLNAWKTGGKPGAIGDGKPAITVVDTPWQNGQMLESFEILNDEEGETERTFLVRLSQGKPPVAHEVRYRVIGNDPVMVYRDEDYQTLINMGDNKGSKAVAKTARRRAR